MSKLTQGGIIRRGVGLSAPVLALLAATSPAAAQTEGTQVAQATPPAAPATAAQKATAAKAAAAKAQPEEVVVTGSRIRQPNLTSVSPLNVVNSQELKLTGVQNVEDLLNNLPQVFAAQGSYLANGSTGAATVNLRGLGSSRTLVLMDGRRLPAGDPRAISADLNTIPQIAIDRVDLITGGASSTYGSDAIAGVVNFVMKKNFEGVRVDAQYGFANHDQNNQRGVRDTILARNNPTQFPLPSANKNDAHTYQASFLMGANSENGKGNITFWGEYQNAQPLSQSERDFSACTLSDNGNGTYSCGGSGTPASTRINTTGTATVTVLPGGAIRPFVAADQFNFAPYNYFQRADDRYNFGMTGHYQISKAFDAYTDFNFADDHTVSQIAPSGLFFGTPFTFNCDNPFLSSQLRTSFAACNANPTASVTTRIGRRLVEGNGRQDDLRHTQYRSVVGLRGDFGQVWNYDVYAQYGTTIFNESYRNDVSVTRANRALQVVNVNGVPTCKSVVDGTDANCVPANIFNVGTLTQKAVNYLLVPALSQGSTTQQIVSGSVGGDLGKYGFKSPFATEGVKINVGSEYRREALNYLPDLTNQTGDRAGAGGPSLPNAGNYDVKEGFLEIKAPLIENKSFIKLLSLDGGYRYSDYSSAGQTDTYKVGLEYSPTDDIRFRASYNYAVRAPNIVELFTAQGLGLFGGNDPCAGTRPQATLAACQRSGVTAAQYGNIFQCSASQCNLLQGGNQNLRPEKAETQAYGFVFTPTFVDGLNMSVDYFKIKVFDYIQAGLDSNLVINQCLVTGNPFFCNQIKRDAGGSINSTTGYVEAFNLNSGSIKTDGFDITLNYRRDLPDWIKGGAGTVSVNLTGTYLKSLVYEPIIGLGAYDCAGFFAQACGTPNPTWRHKVRVTWDTPWDATLSFAWRYFDGVKNPGNGTDPFIGNNPSIADAKLPSVSYLDITTTYRWKYGITLRAGAQNILDQDPPIFAGNSLAGGGAPFGSGNVYAQVYDVVGRRVFLGATVDF